MSDINKMSSLLLRIYLSQIFTISDIWAFRKLSIDFQENFLCRVILKNRYSEQSLCNLAKRRTLPPVFSGEIFENGWLWTAAFEESEIAAFNVILFLTMKIYLGIL